MQRLAEPVRRNLNIAASTSDVVVGGQIANATDGMPLTVVHVDSNTGAGGTGTVEDPFNQLSSGLTFPDSDMEFRTPFKPTARGQARGNSGVYLQSRYECQVLDSFGLAGENNECGGIYSISKPAVNACFPPLTWQTYDIEFTNSVWEDGKKKKNARVTIRQNGIVIHDDVELTHGTPGKLPEAAEPAPLYLQGHGNPVVYRNIWMVKK